MDNHLTYLNLVLEASGGREGGGDDGRDVVNDHLHYLDLFDEANRRCE